MASLPSNTFMFNYNAREYNSSTRTFPKTEGQLFDEDLVLRWTPNSYTDEYVYFKNSSAYMGKTYNSTSANPFNRDSSNKSFTFIYKTSGFTSGSKNIFANRGSDHNYMVRGNMFHTSQSGFLSLTPNTNPQICLIRVYADGKSERKFLDSNGNVLQSTSASSIYYGSASNAIGFFSGYGNLGAEYFNGYFYWMYCSLETLTDAEVKKVIAYNENTTTFETDITAITASYNSTSSAVTLTADEGMEWTASTFNDWISISPSQGTGSSVFVVTIAKNNTYTSRTGLITITNNDGDEITIPATQAKHPILIPKNNIYRGGNRIN